MENLRYRSVVQRCLVTMIFSQPFASFGYPMCWQLHRFGSIASLLLRIIAFCFLTTVDTLPMNCGFLERFAIPVALYKL